MIDEMRAYMNRRGWLQGVRLLELMVEYSEASPFYKSDLELWLKGERSTLFLRDTLARKFRSEFSADITFHNAWAALDTAHYVVMEEHNAPS